MKADLSLSERESAEADDQRELRAALVRRHADVLDEQNAVEGVHIALDTRGPVFRDMAGRLRG